MSDTVDKIARAGDVRIDELTLITSTGFAQDISLQVIAVEIYEDMFAPFITGKVLVKDSQELTNLLPLVGEEIIRITVATPSLPEKHSYSGEYYVYKMDDRQKVAEREVIYVLHFISKEAITDLNKKLSRAYSGKVSSIVESIVKGSSGLQSPKQINIEETDNSTKFVCNFWTPTKAIQFAVDQAVNKSKSPSYVFFENKYGLNFLSFDSIYRNAPVQQKFIWDNYSADTRPVGTVFDIAKDYQRVLELDISDGFNYIDRLKSGMYGSEIIYYDLLAKQYVHKAYVPQFSASSHLNRYPLYTTKVAARPKGTMVYEHQYYNNFDGFDVTSNTKMAQARLSAISTAEGYKVTITVFGRTDYSAGQKVYLSVPKNTQLDPNADPATYEDQIISGNYLIGAICHQIDRQSHQCILELIKDSYMVNLNDPR